MAPSSTAAGHAMELSDNKPFHLVLAHGVADSLDTRQEARKFWSSRFPGALITDFAFVADGVDWGHRGFIERAQVLLNTIQADRREWASRGFSEEYVPCVFLCHELGGSLVKQALTLASRDRVYNLLNDTVIVIFCGTPTFAQDKPDDTGQLLRLLSTLESSPHSPLTLLRELPSELEELSSAFSGIRNQFNVLEVENEEEENVFDSSDRTDTGSTIGSTISPSGEVALRPLINAAQLWQFSAGGKVSETITDRISQVVNYESLPVQKQFHRFLRYLSKISPGNHQPNLSAPFRKELKWIREHSSYGEWMGREKDSPNILYIHGPRGCGSGVVASHLAAVLQDVTDSTVISFSFSSEDVRTQSILAFYVSLIRQMLLNRPALFRLVAGIATWIVDENVYSSEILRNLLLSLLKGSFLHPTFCIVHRVEDCAAFSFDLFLDLLRDCWALSRGTVKVVLTDKEPRKNRFLAMADTCRDIDLSNEAWRDASITQLVTPRVESLAVTRPTWSHCKDEILQWLRNGETNLVQASFAVSLLETAKIPSSKSAVADFVKKMSSSLDSLYELAIDRCQRECPIPLLPLLQWVSHSVRPLNLRDLAVVMALVGSNTVSMNNLRSNLPMRIMHDIQDLNGMLFNVSGFHVYLIHSEMYTVLCKQPQAQDEDPNSLLLLQSFDYLEIALGQFLSMVAQDADAGKDLTALEHSEFGLLPYVVTNWPVQYQRTGNGARQRLKERALELFGNEENARAWFQLYQKYAGPVPKEYPAFDSTLKIASRFGLLDMTKEAIQQLIAKEGSHDQMLSEALALAAGHGHRDVVLELQKVGAQSNDALCLAAGNDFPGVVETLLVGREDKVNQPDQWGRTPFFLAAMNGNEKIASFLLEKGADCRSTVGNGLNALHVAAHVGQSTFLRFLIEAGIDVASTDEYGQDALMIAAEGGFDDVVKLLLELGASVRSQSKNGKTALLLAIEHGQTSTCEILFEAGADLLVTDENGLSPIHVAAREGYLGILRQLILRLPDFVKTEVEDTNRKGRHKVVTIRRMSVKTGTKEVFDESEVVLSPFQLAASHGRLDVVRELSNYARYNSEWNRATALFLSAARGFDDVVTNLLQYGITTIIKDPYGDNALHWASRRLYPTIVAQLLRSSSGSSNLFDLNAVNKRNETPLHVAAKAGRLLTVQLFLHYKASLDGVTEDGRTALHIAASEGHYYIVKDLLHSLEDLPEKGMPVIILQDREKHTAFTLAVAAGHVNVVKALLATAPSFESRTKLSGGMSVLNMAVEAEREDLVKLLIKGGWEANTYTKSSHTTALHLAASIGSVSMIEILLKRRANVNATEKGGYTPLHEAVVAIRSPSAAIRALLRGGARVDEANHFGVTPLWRAAYTGSIEAVEELLKWSPDLEARKIDSKWTPLHAAFDSPRITEMLIKSGANPRAVDRDDSPPFFEAADYAAGAETVRIHLDAGVDPNWTLDSGKTALHIAARGGELRTMQLLVDRGANVNAPDKDGITPLHLAANSGQSELVQYLLDHKADLEIESTRLGTPLMAAVASAVTSIVENLLNAGADVNATSETYPLHTALQIASSMGEQELIEVLLKHGANVNLHGGIFGSALIATIVEERDVKTTKLLLDAGAEINYCDGPKGTALELALGNPREDIVNLLLDPQRNADLNARSKGKYGSALFAAIDAGNLENVRTLLDRKADPELCRYDSSETPMQAAIRKGRLSVLKALVQGGAPLSQQDSQGRGVLSQAILWSSLDLLPYLWENAEPDVNERDRSLRTPLITAVSQGNLESTKELLSRGADVNLRDRRGTTALIEAVYCDYHSIVSLILDRSDVNILTQDDRGRDALYWAARMSSRNNFENVLQEVQNKSPEPSVYQHALGAATAAGKYGFAETLLKASKFNHKQADEDGWTTLHIAEMYRRDDIMLLIEDSVGDNREPVPMLRWPSKWHSTDKALGLHVEPDGTTITIKPDAAHAYSRYGIARADHPMVPRKDKTYYFEVTIKKGGKRSMRMPGIDAGIGFCEENMQMHYMLGQADWSWGYHGDDGNTFNNGQESEVGQVFGETFDEGDTIGCGVNFAEDAAFYTKNGEIIGQAFTSIRGKLFPAISVNLNMRGCKLSLKVPREGDGGSKDFVFKGPCTDPRTLIQSRRAQEQASSDDSSGSSDTSDTTSGSFETDSED